MESSLPSDDGPTHPEVEPFAVNLADRDHTEQDQGATSRRLSSLRRVAVRGGLVLVGSRLVMQIFTWAVTIQVSRLLLPIDYAVMTTGMMIVGFCDLLADAGIGRALVYRQDISNHDANEGFTLSLILSSSLYALIFFSSNWAAAFLNLPEAAAYLRVVALSLLIVPFRTVVQAIVDKQLALIKQSYVNVVSGVSQSLLLIVLVWRGYGYWSFAIVSLCGRLLELAILMKGSGWLPWPCRLTRHSREILTFGFHVSGASLLWFFYSNSDFAIVGRLSGPIALGLYSLAFQLITIPVQKLTSSFNQVSYPIFCRMKDDPDRVRAWYLRLVCLLGFFGIPAMIGLALVAPDAFQLVLGEKWMAAVPAFRIMSVAGAVMVISASLPPLYNAFGRPDINLKYAGACALLLPASFWIAGYWFGMIGVCYVWALFYPLIVIGLIQSTRSITGFDSFDLLRALLPVLIGVGVMAVAVLAFQRFVGNSWALPIRLGVQVFVGAGAYATYQWFVDHRIVTDLKIVFRELRGSAA